MYNIKTLNNISSKGLERLSSNLFAVDEEGAQPDGILVRSAAMQDMALPESLLGIARAGAGVNNIPVDKCSEAGIVVFNTPGANANAVKELVLGGLVLASRKVGKGMEWAKTLAGQGDAIGKLVEKGKSQFTGPELAGKTLGVVGLGAIGVKVANMATHLGMEVLGYDPYISVEGAWSLSRSVRHCVNLSDLIAQCDYITLHIPSTAETKGFVNDSLIAQMKHGVRILNFARAAARFCRMFQSLSGCSACGRWFPSPAPRWRPPFSSSFSFPSGFSEPHTRPPRLPRRRPAALRPRPSSYSLYFCAYLSSSFYYLLYALPRLVPLYC